MEASTLMSLFVPQINQYGIMDEEAEDDELGTPSSSSSCCDSGSSNGSSSSSSELADDASSKLDQISSQGGPYEMASLMAELPFKRGLSRHYQGKSQSFTSLASVRCVEDLVKPERPQYCRKKLKYSCRSYAAGLDSQRPRSSPTLINGCSKAISKRPAGSRGGAAAVVVKRSHGLLGGGGGGARPPVALPHRSGSTDPAASPLRRHVFFLRDLNLEVAGRVW